MDRHASGCDVNQRFACAAAATSFDRRLIAGTCFHVQDGYGYRYCDVSGADVYALLVDVLSCRTSAIVTSDRSLPWRCIETDGLPLPPK